MRGSCFDLPLFAQTTLLRITLQQQHTIFVPPEYLNTPCFLLEN